MARQCWGIAAQPMDTSDKMHKFLELQGALGARWERTHIHGPNKDVFQTIFQSSGLTEEHFRRIWTHAMKLLDEGLLYESTLPKLGHIRVPSLLLLGKYDRVTTPEQVRAFVENVPGAKVAVFEQSGHFPRIDEPAKYAEQVIQFVREHCD